MGFRIQDLDREVGGACGALRQVKALEHGSNLGEVGLRDAGGEEVEVAHGLPHELEDRDGGPSFPS